MSTAAGTASLDPRAQRVIEEQRARRLSRLALRRELRRGAGTQFDPVVVDALVAVVERD